MIVFLLALVASAAVTWFFLLGPRMDSRPGPGPDHEQGDVRPQEPATTPPAPEPSATISSAPEPSAIHLASSPKGADVLEGGRLVGKTPLDIELQFGQRRVLELRLNGYRSAERVIEAGAEQQVFVKLSKVAPKRKKRGKRRKNRPTSKKNLPKPKPADEDLGADLYDL